MKIGILSLQGCVEPHKKHLKALNVDVLEVKYPADCKAVDAYILPGGESSTMLRIMKIFELEDVLKEEFTQKPVWGICAGAILMAKTIENIEQKSFNLMNYSVARNGYGRQIDSRHILVDNYEVSLIRAPIIQQTESDVEILAEYNSTPIWVRSGKYMATTFHPELNNNTPSPIHSYFINLVKSYT